VSLMTNVDFGLRRRAQSWLHWMARRFGVTREGFTRNTVILINLSVFASIFIRGPADDLAKTAVYIGGAAAVLLNLFFSLLARQRGLKLLRENEEWGAYTNWEEWKWWRLIIIYMLQLDFSLAAAEIIMIGQWEHLLVLGRVLGYLALLYAISVPEFPPRETRKSRVAARAHVGAR
jgi:hypothetical protein